MNNAETDVLHESIDRLTQDERLPAGIAGRAFRRHRQRRIALRAATAGTAAIAAGVLATAVLPGAAPRQVHQAQQAQQAPAGSTAQTAAYVFSHTEHALEAVQQENLIEEIHTVGDHYGLGLAQVLTYHLNGGTFHLIKQAGPTAS